MITFNVNDMTCGHCVSTITKAVKTVDPDSDVRIDLSTHQVAIVSGKASAETLSNAIIEAGYAAVFVPNPSAAAGCEVAPRSAGCCCR